MFVKVISADDISQVGQIDSVPCCRSRCVRAESKNFYTAIVVIFEWFVRSRLWCWGGLWSVVFVPIWLFPVCCPRSISTGLVGNGYNSFFSSRSFTKKTTRDCQQWVPRGEAVCLLFCRVAGLEIGWCGNKLQQPVEVLCVELGAFPEWFACGQ